MSGEERYAIGSARTFLALAAKRIRAYPHIICLLTMTTDRWKSLRDFAKSVLGTFVEERAQRFADKPELLPFFRLGRAHLAIVHDQCETFVRLLEGKETGPFFGCVCAALERSPVRHAQRFFCVLQMIHAHDEYLRGALRQTSWFHLITEGACDIYGQSYDLFLRLQEEERAWQRQEPATVIGERSLRFAACAFLDVCRECQCPSPHPDVVIATVRVMDELVGGSISQLDERGVLNVGQCLIASNWNPSQRDALSP